MPDDILALIVNVKDSFHCHFDDYAAFPFDTIFFSYKFLIAKSVYKG